MKGDHNEKKAVGINIMFVLLSEIEMLAEEMWLPIHDRTTKLSQIEKTC
jgi:hypothetical protein